jgi:hypothetical protein
MIRISKLAAIASLVGESPLRMQSLTSPQQHTDIPPPPAATTAAAPLTNICIPDQPRICFDVAVPADTAREGAGDVYLRMRAPASYSWVGLGTGPGMAGAAIYVMYPDGKGNVTLSPRGGRGHTEPKLAEDVEIVRLAGSGIVTSDTGDDGDGDKIDFMVGEFRCVGCATWGTADGESSLNLNGTSDFIAAWKEGGGGGSDRRRSGTESTDPGAPIAYHDGHHEFSLNLAKAAVATTSDVNPFARLDSTNVTDAAMGRPGNGGGGGAGAAQGGSRHPPGLVAHGVIMCVVFALMYPLGAILQPMLRKWWVHASFQVMAFILMWAGFAIGYILARRFRMLFNNAHTTLGLVVCVLMVVQVALGWMHHSYFVKHKRRSGWSHAHMNLGRVLMILGAINGGIGLTIARAPMAYRSSYAIVAAGFLTVYFLLAIATELKRRQAKRNERRASSGERAGSPGPYGYPMTPLGGAVVSKTRTNTGQSI